MDRHALAKLPTFDPKSALISGLSLCLLLRTNLVALAALAGVVAIASKFVLRFHDKHLFNPTNFALVAMMLATGSRLGFAGPVGQRGVLRVPHRLSGGLVVNRAPRAAT